MAGIPLPQGGYARPRRLPGDLPRWYPGIGSAPDSLLTGLIGSGIREDLSQCLGGGGYERVLQTFEGFPISVYLQKILVTEEPTSKRRVPNPHSLIGMLVLLSDLLEYGPVYLSEEELERKVNERLESSYRFLAVSIIGFKGKEFWDYHRSRLKELGHPLRTSRLLNAGLRKIAREILNPEQATEEIPAPFSPSKWNSLKRP